MKMCIFIKLWWQFFSSLCVARCSTSSVHRHSHRQTSWVTSSVVQSKATTTMWWVSVCNTTISLVLLQYKPQALSLYVRIMMMTMMMVCGMHLCHYLARAATTVWLASHLFRMEMCARWSVCMSWYNDSIAIPVNWEWKSMFLFAEFDRIICESYSSPSLRIRNPRTATAYSTRGVCLCVCCSMFRSIRSWTIKSATIKRVMK